jgi:predicted Zn-dependent protease
MDPFGRPRARRRFGGARLLIALVIAGITLIGYWSKRDVNPTTGEMQHVDLSPEQEIALGLQAAPEMAQQHGGLYPDARVQQFAKDIGHRLVSRSFAKQSPYQFDFHVLADPETINAFALPGGQVFITAALFDRFNSPGQLAGVFGHEIGHVIGRHGAEHMAKAQLLQGLTGAAVIATYDPGDPASRNSAAVAQMIGQLVNLKYGRSDELESDQFGVRIMAEAGYDPRSMLRVMEILRDAAGGDRPPEWFSTHPNPENRLETIQQAIDSVFPSGVPAGLEG